MTLSLPVPVLEYPHWRVNLRPAEYQPNRLPSLGDCLKTVEATKVRLRGWDYPHISRRDGQVGRGNDYVDSWTNSTGHVEYWRFYQSAQFLHLFAVREAVEGQWAEKLRGDAIGHIGGTADVLKAPGFFSLPNIIYTITEVFEFGSRLCQREVYTGPVTIELHIRKAAGFGLVPDLDRAWSEHRALTSNDVGNTWLVDSPELIAATADRSLDAILWFFERFGWFDPPSEVIRRDQERFLRGRL